MKKWKQLTALGLSALLAVSMVGCGASSGSSSGSASSDSSSSDSSSSATTITFWNSFTGADGDMLTDLVDQYNKENTDGITVKMDITSDLDSQLSSAYSVDKGPTIVLSSSATRFTYGKYYQDISDFFDKTGMDKSDFKQTYLDYCSEGDKLYFIPFQIVGFYLYWNKDLFQAAGLDPEKGPSTWDEFAEYAKKIADPDKNIYGAGISYDYNYQIAHMMQRFGGLAVTKDGDKWQANFKDNAGYKKFLTMYSDLIKAGANSTEKDTDSMMTAGQLGMTVGGPWETAGMDKAGINYGVELLPTGDAGEMNSVEVLGFSISTSASDAEKEAAYKFIKWWNTAGSDGSSPALQWSLKNGYPAYLNSVEQSADYQSNEKLKSMTPSNPDAPSDFITDSSFPGIGGILSDVIPPMINSVAFDSGSIDDVLNTAQENAQKVVDQYN